MHHTVMDHLSMQDTVLHRLDARSKIIAVVAFTVLVISLPRTGIAIIAVSAIGPFSMLLLARVPLKLATLQIACLCPFILIIAISSAFYDRTAVTVAFGAYQFNTTQGTIAAVAIFARFAVTMMAIIALSATTRLSDMLFALSSLRLPNILVMQIGLLYRYIFLIIDRACHMLRARAGRKLQYLGLRTELSTSAAMIASLFAASTQTAYRVSDAMMARGFDGTTRSLKKNTFSIADAAFLAAVCAYMALLLALKGII